MAKDIQTITFRDLLEVQDTLPAYGILPESIYIVGKDFSSAIEVYINGLLSPEFIGLTRKRILAQVPVSLVGRITRVEVVSARVTLTYRSRVAFGVGPYPRMVEGIEKLIQNFVKLLLQRPGSDLYNQDAGGGILSIVGSAIEQGVDGSLSAKISQGVDRAFRFMQKSQSTETNLPPTERILSAELLKLEIDERSTSAAVTIRLISEAGEEATPRLAL